MPLNARLERVTDPDGAIVETLPLPADEASLEELLRDLFEITGTKSPTGR